MTYLVQNLKCISTVKVGSSVEDQNLVASFSSKTIYKTNSFWGSIFWGCYKIIQLIDWSKSFERSCLDCAIQNTYDELQDSLSSMEQAANRSHQQLSDKLMGTAEESVFEGYDILSRSFTFIETGFADRGSIQAVCEVFKKVKGFELSEKKIRLIVVASASHAVWSRFNGGVETGTWKMMGKAFSGESLSEREDALLRKAEDVFFRALPRESRALLAYHSLNECSHALFDSREGSLSRTCATGRFWAHLDDKGSIKQLLKHDQRHKAEVLNLDVHSELDIEESQITLSGKNISGENNHNVFSIEEDPSLELVAFKSSPMDLSLELLNRRMHVPSGYQPHVRYIDPDGKFLIQSRGDHFLEEHDWQIDTQNGELSKESMALLGSFGSLVNTLAMKTGSLPVFSSKSFLVSKDNKMIFSGSGVGESGQDGISFYFSIKKALGGDRGGYTGIDTWGLNQFPWKIPSPLTNILPMLLLSIEKDLGQQGESLQISKKKLAAEMRAALNHNIISKEEEWRNLQVQVLGLCSEWKTRISTVYDVKNEKELELEIKKQVLKRVEDFGFAAALCIESYSREIVLATVQQNRYLFKGRELSKLSSMFSSLIDHRGVLSERIKEAYLSYSRGNPSAFLDLWKRAGGASSQQFTKWVGGLGSSDGALVSYLSMPGGHELIRT